MMFRSGGSLRDVAITTALSTSVVTVSGMGRSRYSPPAAGTGPLRQHPTLAPPSVGLRTDGFRGGLTV